ncbi:MAG: hypothetical protein K9M03_02125 [Kiritimatiellales bacterium]|nr:hypothetical protein [Kiritimatiellales bacterium]
MLVIKEKFGNRTFEHRLIRLRAAKEFAAETIVDDQLDHLGGFQRTKESTLGAAGNILKGGGKVLTGKPINGILQMGQGGLDAFDTLPSVVADGIRSATGPDNSRGPSAYNYNISRAIGSFRQIEKPSDAIGAVVDVAHASIFKLGSDALKAARKISNN